MTTLTFVVEAVSVTKRQIEIVASTSEGDDISLAIVTVDGVVLPKVGSELTVSFGQEVAE